MQMFAGIVLSLALLGSSHAQELTDDDLLQDDELSASSLEVIASKPSMILLGLGAYDAWQRVGIGYQYCQSLWLCWRSTIGGGRFVSDVKADEVTYEMSTQARTIAVGLRSFFPIGLPLYSQTGMGWSWWSIEAMPRDATEEEAKDRLSFSAQSQGFFLTQQFGFQLAWSSGWTMEMSLVGFSRAKTSAVSVTTSSAKAKKSTRKNLEHQQAWGILNIGVGYAL